MEKKTHTETTRILEEYCLKGGVFGNKEQAEASKQREKQGNSYLLSRVFMKNSVLKEMYPELKEKPYLIPAYQIKRWMKLFNKNKRKQVQAEIKRVNSISRESIDSFDKLLTSVGL